MGLRSDLENFCSVLILCFKNFANWENSNKNLSYESQEATIKKIYDTKFLSVCLAETKMVVKRRKELFN